MAAVWAVVFFYLASCHGLRSNSLLKCCHASRVFSSACAAHLGSHYQCAHSQLLEHCALCCFLLMPAKLAQLPHLYVGWWQKALQLAGRQHDGQW